ncbi:MAG TPA: hypothetical protein V6C58_07360 [Allocoleopsis sp.]
MIILPAQLDGYRNLKDKSVKITFETQELTPAEIGELHSLTGSFCYVAIKQETFQNHETKMMEEMQSDYEVKGISNSKRLKNVLYRLWEQEPEGFTTSVQHYEHHMEKIIKHFKSKLK